MIATHAQRAMHQGTQPFHPAPNAALLIDFDNVTLGIRKDLGKELKTLLNSDVIRGKVAVQRAYADWRRYPQYIVPLAESSIDLIFAPAYGSSKKNATDLRMAIDAMELVFTRPEIGTFILLTGDSDFSSCVLKLKEYGKYVIGVGMRESSSDLLIQNCDEYYSYHSLSGLTRAGEDEGTSEDPWALVQRAAQQMIANRDTMRTDRLKQVMLDLDPAFDEKQLGYSKFSRFVSEAATKGLIRLKKMENGQYEIMMDGDGTPTTSDGRADRGTDTSRGRGRGRGRRQLPADRARAEMPAELKAPEPIKAAEPAEVRAEAAAPTVVEAPADLQAAYVLLLHGIRALDGGVGKGVRDGDVKRKMLDLAPDFDESTLGFSKFSRFLRQAHDAEIVDLNRVSSGHYEVAISPSAPKLPPLEALTAEPSAAPAEEPRVAETPKAAEEPGAPEEPGTPAQQPPARRLRGRRGGRRTEAEGPPPLLPGQTISPPPTLKSEPEVVAAAPEPAAEEAPRKRGRSRTRKPKAEPVPPPISAKDLGLPRDESSIQAYLTNSYRGVGKKTAESLSNAFGEDVFQAMQEEPQRVRELLGERRGNAILEQWAADYERRSSAEPGDADAAAIAEAAPAQPSSEAENGGDAEAERALRRGRSRTRRGGRGRGRSNKGEPAPA